MTRIILHGCNGHMGKMISSTALEESGVSIAAGVDIARVLMESGAAYRKLNEWRVASFEGYDFDDDDE